MKNVTDPCLLLYYLLCYSLSIAVFLPVSCCPICYDILCILLSFYVSHAGLFAMICLSPAILSGLIMLVYPCISAFPLLPVSYLV